MRKRILVLGFLSLPYLVDLVSGLDRGRVTLRGHLAIRYPYYCFLAGKLLLPQPRQVESIFVFEDEV